ncbi:MAG TPA: VWD domain-containing protein [Acidimicrobiia bacterium]|nr:VWD domain-containing protein [Acidimicrobiia bacterium]
MDVPQDEVYYHGSGSGQGYDDYQPQYGSFIFFEFIEPASAPKGDTVKAIYDAFASGAGVLAAVDAAVTDDLGDVARDFWMAAYEMQPGPFHIDPDVGDWMSVLSQTAKGRRKANGVWDKEVSLPSGTQHPDQIDLYAGGSYHWEVSSSSGTPSRVTVELQPSSASGVPVVYRLHTYRKNAFPEPCYQDAQHLDVVDPRQVDELITVSQTDPPVTRTVLVDSDCFLAVSAFNTDLPQTVGSLSGGVDVNLVDLPAVDLGVGVVDDPDPATRGGEVTYTATVENFGADPSDRFLVRFDLPDGTTPSGMSSPSGSSQGCSQGAPGAAANNVVFCEHLGLPAGSSESFQVTVDIDPAHPSQTISTVVDVLGLNDPNTVNDRATADTQLASGANLKLNYSQTPIYPGPGSLVTITHEVVNLGPGQADDVVLTIQRPPELTDWTFPAECVETAVAGELVCQLGSIGPNSSKTVVLTVLIPEDYAGGDLTIEAEVTSSTGDPVLSDNRIIRPILQIRKRPCGSGCVAASVWGDPHLVTFDGLSYDLQTVGEHVLFETLDGSVVVQTRHQPWGTSDRVSVATAVAAKVGASRVGFYVGGDVRVDGDLVTIPDGDYLPLPDGAAIFRTGSTYTVGWPGTGDERPRLDVKMNNGHLNLTPFLPASYAGQIRGLLGDADGDHTNDFALRDGTQLGNPISTTTLYGPYADSWRISQAESLFDYETGKSTETFTDFSFPSGVLTVGDLDPDARALAETICRAAGVSDPIILESCIVDVAITGDSAFTEGAIGVPTVASALGSGFLDDFEDGTAEGWSSPVVTTVENGSTRFMGPHGAGSNTWSISGLPPHTEVLVSFDLYVLGGWDGDDGPDAIEVTFGDGTTILAQSTFSNTSATQSYPSPGSAAQSGAVSTDDLGTYGGDGSSTYHVEATLSHWQETLSVVLNATGISTAAGEFWGVDNLELQLVRLPPDQFEVVPDLRIPDDVANSRAGNLELPRSEDHYRFTVGSGFQGIYVDALACVSNGRFEVLDAAGERVLERSCGDFELDLPDGDYTLAVRSSSAATGTYSLYLYAVPDDLTEVIVPGGDPVTVQTVVGQNATITYEAQAGDRVSMKITQSGFGYFNLLVQVTTPSGSTVWLAGTWGSSVYFDVEEMPETGTYTISFDPKGATTGTTTITAWDVPDDAQATTLVGSDVTIATTTPGQNAYVTFDASQGDRVSMLLAHSYGDLNLGVTVTAPSGATVWSAINNFGRSKYFDVTEMPETGTYTIFLNPKGDRTGSSTITLTPG